MEYKGNGKASIPNIIPLQRAITYDRSPRETPRANGQHDFKENSAVSLILIKEAPNGLQV